MIGGKEVCWGVRHELELVRLIFVVASDVEHHHMPKEHLGGSVVAKQSVPADIEQLAIGDVGNPGAWA